MDALSPSLPSELFPHHNLSRTELPRRDWRRLHEGLPEGLREGLSDGLPEGRKTEQVERRELNSAGPDVWQNWEKLETRDITIFILKGVVWTRSCRRSGE